MHDNNIQIACLCETFLKPSIRLPRDPDFAVYRKDRDGNKGGVAIIINKIISHKLLPTIDTKHIENVGVEVEIVDGSKIQIFAVYLPGALINSEITKYLAYDLSRITGRRPSYFACGDFNARHRHWNCNRANTAGNILYEYYCRNNFIISHPDEETYIPTDPNKAKSTIDLVITNGIHQIETIKNSILISDHTGVEMTIKIGIETARSQQRMKLDYSKANWKQYKRSLSRNIESEVSKLQLNSTEDINSFVSIFTKTIIDSRDDSVPVAFHNEYKLNIPDKLMEVIKMKNRLKNIWKRSRQPTVKSTVNKLEKFIKDKIQIIRNENWAHKLRSIKPGNQSVWNVARFLKNGNRILPPLKDGNFIATTNMEKANKLAETFEANHNNPRGNIYSFLDLKIEDSVNAFLAEPIDFQIYPEIAIPPLEEMQRIIKMLPNKKAPGNDDIRNCMMKNLPEIGFIQLHRLLSACIKLSYFPSSWKSADVIPIHKPNKPATDPNSYRPISLLSGLSKVLERMMLGLITHHTDEKGIIPDIQHGFRTGKSTIHQLDRVIKQAKDGLQSKKSTGMIILDVEKAFDRVWSNGLLYKMIDTDFHPSIIKFVASFLEDRKFKVIINGEHSNIKNMPFGVPQGAVLSPILYNIFTSDTPQSGLYSSALFADDTAKYHSSERIKPITNALKRAAEDTHKYFNKWKIGVNGSKTKAILMTRRRLRELPTGPLHIFNTDVNWENEIKYLGIFIDKRLTFKSHIDYVIGRANNAIRTLYPLLCRKSSLHIKNKLLIYKLAIRPILTYGMPAMKGIAKTHIKKLQTLQNKSLKMILDKPRLERTRSIHEIAKCPMMEDYIDKITNKFTARL